MCKAAGTEHIDNHVLPFPASVYKEFRESCLALFAWTPHSHFHSAASTHNYNTEKDCLASCISSMSPHLHLCPSILIKVWFTSNLKSPKLTQAHRFDSQEQESDPSLNNCHCLFFCLFLCHLSVLKTLSGLSSKQLLLPGSWVNAICFFVSNFISLFSCFVASSLPSGSKNRTVDIQRRKREESNWLIFQSMLLSHQPYDSRHVTNISNI